MNIDFHRPFLFIFFGILLFPFLSAAKPAKDISSSSDIITLNNAVSAIIKNENPTVENYSEYASEETTESEKILVVLMDSYGIQNYSKIVITDVDMELSILIAKDIFDKLPGGIYTIIASSANDLISQKLIIQ